MESDYAANQPVDEKGKKKGGASPSIAQLLMQHIDSDETARLASQSEASAENAEGAPTVVYLLSDFPSTADEAEQLIKASTESKGMLDGVLHFVWRPGMATTGGNQRSGGGSGGASSSGGMASSVSAFNSLPHLEQTRTAAAASRVSRAGIMYILFVCWSIVFSSMPTSPQASQIFVPPTPLLSY